MRRYIILSFLFCMTIVFFTSGCATYPSLDGFGISSYITYGYYYRYINLTIYNYSNYPVRITSISATDLNTGENFSFSTNTGDWLYPGEVFSDRGDPISPYIHGSIRITICGKYSNGKTVCDSTTITL